MQATHVTGTGIAVFNDGQIVYLKAYGVRDKEKDLPLTPDTVIPAESLTKSAFATMVMQLVERRIINLDTPISEYLPKPLSEYPAYQGFAGDPRYKLITMRMLLDHTSGFPNWRWFTDEKKLSICFAPGSRFAYSGEGFALAQMVVESVTGLHVQEQMEEQIFKPLGMTNTSMICGKPIRAGICEWGHTMNRANRDWIRKTHERRGRGNDGNDFARLCPLRGSGVEWRNPRCQDTRANVQPANADKLSSRTPLRQVSANDHGQ